MYIYKFVEKAKFTDQAFTNLQPSLATLVFFNPRTYLTCPDHNTKSDVTICKIISVVLLPEPLAQYRVGS